LLQKGNFMKTIFNINNRGKFILYILFAVAMLSFAFFLLWRILFHVDISPLAIAISFIGITFFGGLIIQNRNGPPW